MAFCWGLYHSGEGAGIPSSSPREAGWHVHGEGRWKAGRVRQASSAPEEGGPREERPGLRRASLRRARLRKAKLETAVSITAKPAGWGLETAGKSRDA